MLAWFFYVLQSVITLAVDTIVIASVVLYAFFALNFCLDILAYFKPSFSASGTTTPTIETVTAEKKNE